MDTYRDTSLLVGVLYILGLLAGILSIARAVDNSDFLIKAAQNSFQTNFAASFQFFMAFIYIGIAVLLYPILKIYNETLAIGFFSFRIIAVLFLLIGILFLLMILNLSQEYVKRAPSDSSSYLIIGRLLKSGRDLVNHVGMIIPLCTGGVLLYVVMLQSGLIPMWISVWGIIGSSMAILASVLVMRKSLEIQTPTYIILNMPIALQEVVFAIWLIVIGFKQAQ